MRISDWSSDVCSSDLRQTALADQRIQECGGQRVRSQVSWLRPVGGRGWRGTTRGVAEGTGGVQAAGQATDPAQRRAQHGGGDRTAAQLSRSEEHTSELQSLMRNSYAVFCLKKKTNPMSNHIQQQRKSKTTRHYHI